MPNSRCEWCSPRGVSGSYVQCGNNQLLSYWAPANIDSQRGTLSFFLTPKMAEVTLAVPAGADLKGATVTVECGGTVPEITLMNNSVTL